MTQVKAQIKTFKLDLSEANVNAQNLLSELDSSQLKHADDLKSLSQSQAMEKSKFEASLLNLQVLVVQKD